MPVRKLIYTFTVPASTDWQAIRASQLGIDGYVLSVAFRLHTGGTNGSITARLIDDNSALPLSSAEIAAIPGEFVVLESVKALTANVPVTINIVGSVSQSAAYLSSRTEIGERAPLLAVKGDATLAGQVTVVVRALDNGCDR